MATSLLLRKIKSALFSADERQFCILFGPYRGLRVIERPSTSLQIRLGLWERETYPALRHALRRALWVIDVGSGGGELVIAFAKSTSASPIFAIDPDQSRCDRLNENMALNEVAQTSISVIRQSVGTKSLQLDSLPVLRHLLGFIKIDVDGSEIDVLNSGLGLLAEARPLLLIETHSAELENECIKLLASLSFSTRIIHNARWRRIIPETRHGHNRWLLARP